MRELFSMSAQCMQSPEELVLGILCFCRARPAPVSFLVVSVIVSVLSVCLSVCL